MCIFCCTFAPAFEKKQAQMEQTKARREQEREERRRARQKQTEEAKRKREERKEANHRIGKCVVCGNEFDTYNPAQKTCSKECGKKLAHAHKHKRIPKSQLVDKDITLEALYRRDSGVCRLCGYKELTQEGPGNKAPGRRSPEAETKHGVPGKTRPGNRRHRKRTG